MQNKDWSYLLGQKIGLLTVLEIYPPGVIIDELIVCNDNNTETAYISANMTLVSLIRGNSEIIKLPWKPKKGELYYSFGFRNCPKWGVSQQNWGNHPCDYALLDKGWIYRTRAEAEAVLPAVAKELGVEYEL